MVRGMATNEIRFGQFREFSMQRPQVHAVVNATAIPTLSAAYLPLRDCTYGMHSQRSPNCDHRHENVGLHDR